MFPLVSTVMELRQTKMLLKDVCEELDEEARKKMQEVSKVEHAELQKCLCELRDQSVIFLEVVEFELKEVIMAALEHNDTETWGRSAVELARCYLSFRLSSS